MCVCVGGGGGGCDKAKTCSVFLIDSNKLDSLGEGRVTWRGGGGGVTVFNCGEVIA